MQEFNGLFQIVNVVLGNICWLFLYRKCGCGKTSQPVQCGQSQPLTCGAECGNILNCGEHKCTQICHVGACEPCKVTIKQGKVKSSCLIYLLIFGQ